MQLISPKEAAEKIGVSLTTVKAWIQRSEQPLPTIAVGNTGKHRRVIADAIGPWLESEAARQIAANK